MQYRDKTFHIQTEDRGRDDRKIESQIFHSGAILDTLITSYEELLERDFPNEEARNDEIQSMMKDNHRQLYKRLMAGEYDEFAGLEPLDEVPVEVEEIEEDFQPGQDRVPAAAIEMEQGGDDDIEQMNIPGAPGVGEHIDLSKLKQKLKSTKSEASVEPVAEEAVDDEPPPTTQVTSFDKLGSMLSEDRSKGAKAASSAPRAAPQHAPMEWLSLQDGVDAWQGCEPPEEDLSLTELVEAQFGL